MKKKIHCISEDYQTPLQRSVAFMKNTIVKKSAAPFALLHLDCEAYRYAKSRTKESNFLIFTYSNLAEI